MQVPPPPREARCAGYRRSDPTRTELYELLREHLETFLAETEALPGGGLPAFVKRELRSYLECGILAHGFARVHCSSCGRDSLVAFSCKGRGFCPSCGGRRMSSTATHLVDHVLPETPIRQWVLTLPFPLRLACAFDRGLCAELRRIFVRAVFSHLARQGRSLNLNPHFHALFIDGVYTRDDPFAPARFHELSAPTRADVERVLARIHACVARALERRAAEGRDEHSLEIEGLLVHLADAAVRGRAGASGEGDPPPPAIFAPEPAPRPAAPPALVARGGGFSLHAGVSVPADRRGRLERLCRYVARPALATERLSVEGAGRILYAHRHPYAGRTHAVFTPRTLLERLCALIPFPRTHLSTYHGVLAPASTWRDDVVPSPPRRRRARRGSPSETSPARRTTWAELMKSTFALELLRCECGGERKVIACILDRTVARRILRHLGLPADPPLSKPSRAPPLLDFGA